MTVADYACCYEYCKITMMQGERAEKIYSRIQEMTEQIWLPNEGDYRKVKREEGE
jgi:hypothetical protein